MTLADKKAAEKQTATPIDPEKWEEILQEVAEKDDDGNVLPVLPEPTMDDLKNFAAFNRKLFSAAREAFTRLAWKRKAEMDEIGARIDKADNKSDLAKNLRAEMTAEVREEAEKTVHDFMADFFSRTDSAATMLVFADTLQTYVDHFNYVGGRDFENRLFDALSKDKKSADQEKWAKLRKDFESFAATVKLAKENLPGDTSDVPNLKAVRDKSGEKFTRRYNDDGVKVYKGFWQIGDNKPVQTGIVDFTLHHLIPALLNNGVGVTVEYVESLLAAENKKWRTAGQTTTIKVGDKAVTLKVAAVK